MAVPEPGCCDGPNDLLRKILLGLGEITIGGGGGAIIVQDEGIVLTPTVAQFNFVGAGVTATAVGNNVTVTIPSGGAGDVVGPAVSVNNNIVTFDGITGKLIKDSGVAISSLITTSNLQSGSGSVLSGANSLAIVFPVPFAAPPTVVASIGHPTGEANNIVNILTDTVTALGFTARLTGAAPSANYRILWHAHL